jgi:hypothetical protein
MGLCSGQRVMQVRGEELGQGGGGEVVMKKWRVQGWVGEGADGKEMVFAW